MTPLDSPPSVAPDDAPAPDAVPDAVPPEARRVVLVTGPSGAGRSTAIRVLEDLGFEVIDNLPLSLLPRLLDGPPIGRPLALGLDARNRDWGPEGLAEGLAGAIDRLADRAGLRSEVLYLDCSDEVLLRRFSETRRRHPLAPESAPETGIRIERELLEAVRRRADILIDTGELTVHDLRAAIERWYAPAGHPLAVTVESFSYKRGLPPGLDMAFDCRFLRNPHWEPTLRPLDGRAPEVAAFVAADALHDAFLARAGDLLLSLLPAFQAEGKSHLAVGLGCTGGQHRSVALTESLSRTLAEAGWRVSKRHRELERRAGVMGAAASGKSP